MTSQIFYLIMFLVIVFLVAFLAYYRWRLAAARRQADESAQRLQAFAQREMLPATPRDVGVDTPRFASSRRGRRRRESGIREAPGADCSVGFSYLHAAKQDRRRGRANGGPSFHASQIRPRSCRTEGVA